MPLMKDREVQPDLYKKYKHLFVSNFWGFEVPDTWMWIIELYLRSTQFDVDRNGLEIQICQIKEKFGGLKIYTDTNEKRHLDDCNIAYCQALADYTCAECGCMSQHTKATKGWITYLCPECMEKREVADKDRKEQLTLDLK